MNCKPGDLAICFKGYHPDDMALVGQIFKVVSIYGTNVLGQPCWVYEGEIRKDASGRDILAVCDETLRPIRDNDGEDETLTWAGKPERINA
jgi:hypothetical protein